MMKFILLLSILIITLAILAPVIFAVTNRWLEGQRNKWARQRLEKDELFNVGAHITRLELHGHPVPLMSNCDITKMENGYVEVTGPAGRKMSFSCREFESLHPVFGEKLTPRRKKR